jgi:hypothetical protein
MKLIIAGSHSFTNYQLLCQTLAQERPRITEIIHGGAPGGPLLGHVQAAVVCAPTRLRTSGAGTVRAAWARACLVGLACAGVYPGGSAPPDPCQAAAGCRSIGLLLPGCVLPGPSGPVLPRRHQDACLILTGVLLGANPGSRQAAAGCCGVFSSWKATQGNRRSLLRQVPGAQRLPHCCATGPPLDTHSL